MKNNKSLQKLSKSSLDQIIDITNELENEFLRQQHIS